MRRSLLRRGSNAHASLRSGLGVAGPDVELHGFFAGGGFRFGCRFGVSIAVALEDQVLKLGNDFGILCGDIGEFAGIGFEVVETLVAARGGVID